MAENVAKVAVVYVIEAGAHPPDIEGVITFHVRKLPSAEPWGEDDRIELAGRAWDWWAGTGGAAIIGDPARERFATYMRLDRIEVSAVEPAAVAPTVVYPDGDDRYGNGGGHIAPQCAHVVGLRTAVNTRRGRGRIYYPATAAPLGEGAALGLLQHVEQTELGRITGNLATCVRGLSLEADPWVLAVYSRLDHAGRAVTHFVVPDRLGTQRRRATRAQSYLGVGLLGDPVEPAP